MTASRQRLTPLQRALIQPRRWRQLPKGAADRYMDLRDTGTKYKRAERLARKAVR